MISINEITLNYPKIVEEKRDSSQRMSETSACNRIPIQPKISNQSSVVCS